ncbi:YdbL family protein [Crenothrix sp.]|uniref:YdbL family protein n=1 Tax=Crenothrix sp. TaxID=3100433 RepID=UPI00374DA3DA
MRKISVLTALLLTACVTINIYFPAAAAEKAADEIIKDIQKNTPQKMEPKPKAELSDWQLSLYKMIDSAINVAISSAQAADADLSINSPDIQRLRASMAKRFATLQVFYGNGSVGIKSDGLLVVKDTGSVALKDKNQINKLIASENADRLALYKAIANANGHPEWAAQIKSTFAAQWISNAQSGWWVQSGGNWKQK